MIIFCEGPRNSGKTYLIQKLFERTQQRNKLEYYKFYLAKYIEEYGLQDLEKGPAMHYFSLGNIMTILQLEVHNRLDKVLVFDRSLFSAYVWAILRDRLPKERLLKEYTQLVNDDRFYRGVHTIYVERNFIEEPDRTKDYFDKFADYAEEDKLFNELFELGSGRIDDGYVGNRLTRFTNDFTEKSVDNFIAHVEDLVFWRSR